jgi:hypothetical protein
MLSKSFQFFSLVLNGKHLPVEKVRDEDTRMITLRSAAPFAMNDVHVQEFFAKPAEQVSAFAIGLAKNLQQSMRYGLYGMVMNYLSEKVFTPRDVFASDEVKVHLGLTGPNAGKSFLDM